MFNWLPRHPANFLTDKGVSHNLGCWGGDEGGLRGGWGGDKQFRSILKFTQGLWPERNITMIWNTIIPVPGYGWGVKFHLLPWDNTDQVFLMTELWGEYLGLRREEIRANWRKLHTGEFYYFYFSPDIIRVQQIKENKMTGNLLLYSILALKSTTFSWRQMKLASFEIKSFHGGKNEDCGLLGSDAVQSSIPNIEATGSSERVITASQL